jgi:large subunit ribosomal protein L30e
MTEDALNIRKELEKSLESGKIEFGKNRVLRALKQGTASKVFYAKNTPDKLKKDLKYYSNLSEVQLVEFPGDSKELGVALGRTHNVLLAVIVKG